MKLLVIAMVLASFSVMADDHKVDAHKVATEACKEHAKDKKALEACITEHMKAAPVVETAAPAHKK